MNTHKKNQQIFESQNWQSNTQQTNIRIVKYSGPALIFSVLWTYSIQPHCIRMEAEILDYFLVLFVSIICISYYQPF